jgi:starch phosphorylase
MIGPFEALTEANPCPEGGSHVASLTTEDSLKQYEAEFRFADRDYYDRHLVFDQVVTMEQADQRQRFEAMAGSLRDLLTQRWLLTQSTHDRANPKQVYYLSMEFLIGRSLLSSVTNMRVESFVDEDLRSDRHQNWHELLEAEPDAGLGNGGLVSQFRPDQSGAGLPCPGWRSAEAATKG